MIQLLALAGAWIEAGGRALTAADLNRGHMLATRAFESGKLDAVLVEHDCRDCLRLAKQHPLRDRGSVRCTQQLLDLEIGIDASS